MTPMPIDALGQLLLSMRRTTLRGGVGLVLLGALLPACGEANPRGQEETGKAQGSPELAESSPLTERSTSYEVLHEFTVADGQRFTFILLSSGDGPGEIMISDEFSTVDYYSALLQQHGSLTALETFLAFAPEGIEPDPALVAAHESEARGLGRGTDSTVKIVNGLDPELLIEKGIPIECRRDVFFDPGNIRPLVWREFEAQVLVDIDNVEIFGCVGEPQVIGTGSPTGCELFGANAMLEMYACNDSLSAPGLWSRNSLRKA